MPKRTTAVLKSSNRRGPITAKNLPIELFAALAKAMVVMHRFEHLQRRVERLEVKRYQFMAMSGQAAFSARLRAIRFRLA
jgi:hypothetical protein